MYASQKHSKAECPRHWILNISNTLLKTPVSIIITLFTCCHKSVNKILVEIGRMIILSSHYPQHLLGWANAAGKKKKKKKLDFGLWPVWDQWLKRTANPSSFCSTEVTECLVIPIWCPSPDIRKTHLLYINIPFQSLWYMTVYVFKTWKWGLLHVHSADVGQSGLPWTTGLQ